MEAKEKLERFSKEVILDASPRSEAAASGVESVEVDAFIGLLNESDCP
jgi:hypothetical protein